MDQVTFIIDCNFCKAKVAAIQIACDTYEDVVVDEELGEMLYPFVERLYFGRCPQCKALLVGKSQNIGAWNLDDCRQNNWSSIVRVYPNPPKSFSSYRIPKSVEISFREAELSLQCNANIAACVMLGRTLEAVCRNIIEKHSAQLLNSKDKALLKKHVMLAEGIKKLKEMKIIDERLYEWSQQLRVFRNLAAHAVDVNITRRDAEDLKIFVQAIIEYIYDLNERYEEFMSRSNNNKK